MCNCVKKNPSLLGQRSSLRSSPQARTYYAVFDIDGTQLSGRFTEEGRAEAKRERLCRSVEGDCAYLVQEAA